MRTAVSAEGNNFISRYCFKVAMGHDLGVSRNALQNNGFSL